jgi:hypothetical protein
MGTKVPPKRRDNSTAPGGDILEDVVQNLKQKQKFLSSPNIFLAEKSSRVAGAPRVSDGT